MLFGRGRSKLDWFLSNRSAKAHLSEGKGSLVSGTEGVDS